MGNNNLKDTPYKRFESFLKRLVAVPKAEIDAKEGEYKRNARPARAMRQQSAQDRAQP